MLRCMSLLAHIHRSSRCSDLVTVNCKVHGRSAQIKFQSLSGDWFAASLSDDGRHLVLAEPYDIALYALDECPLLAPRRRSLRRCNAILTLSPCAHSVALRTLDLDGSPRLFEGSLD